MRKAIIDIVAKAKKKRRGVHAKSKTSKLKKQ